MLGLHPKWHHIPYKVHRALVKSSALYMSFPIGGTLGGSLQVKSSKYKWTVINLGGGQVSRFHSPWLPPKWYPIPFMWHWGGHGPSLINKQVWRRWCMMVWRSIRRRDWLSVNLSKLSPSFYQSLVFLSPVCLSLPLCKAPLTGGSKQSVMERSGVSHVDKGRLSSLSGNVFHNTFGLVDSWHDQG